jgi:hypothetical protein
MSTIFIKKIVWSARLSLMVNWLDLPNCETLFTGPLPINAYQATVAQV